MNVLENEFVPLPIYAFIENEGNMEAWLSGGTVAEEVRIYQGRAPGIAASALSFALLEDELVDAESEVPMKQGRAMGEPSSCAIRF